MIPPLIQQIQEWSILGTSPQLTWLGWAQQQEAAHVVGGDAGGGGAGPPTYRPGHQPGRFGAASAIGFLDRPPGRRLCVVHWCCALEKGSGEAARAHAIRSMSNAAWSVRHRAGREIHEDPGPQIVPPRVLRDLLHEEGREGPGRRTAAPRARAPRGRAQGPWPGCCCPGLRTPARKQRTQQSLSQQPF